MSRASTRDRPIAPDEYVCPITAVAFLDTISRGVRESSS